MKDTDLIKRSIEEAETQERLFQGASVGLKMQYCREFEFDRGLTEGCEVEIAFSDGTERAIYLGFRSTGYAMWVNYRLFTKKGKPYKSVHRDDYEVMPFITKV